MKFLRSKNTAAECKYLRKIATTYPENRACAHASFACSNKKVCDVHENVTVVTFDSLDFCCTCEHFRKDENK